MLERDITTKILRYLKTVPKCFCWKQHGGQFGTAGIPDIIACFRGMFVAFEVKNTNGRLSKLQEVTLGRISEAGGRAFVVRSLDDVLSALESMEVVNEYSVGVSGQESGYD